MSSDKKENRNKKNNSGSTQNNYVIPDLSFPDFMDELRNLNKTDYEQFKKRIQHIKKMTWQQVYETSRKGANKSGLNWELIEGQSTADGELVASIRISLSFRARVSRKDEVMRFISLHPDHDSAYK